MEQDHSAESRRPLTALVWHAYDRNEFLLDDDDLSGCTHLLASRQGLFALSQSSVKRIARGFFFGITLRDEDIFVFDAGDQPRGPTFRGRIVRLTRRGDRIVQTTVLVKGLDNGCHQIDFVDGRLHVVDTYNQQLVRLSEDMLRTELVRPLPHLVGDRWGEDRAQYMHVNSLLQVGDVVLLLLHNGAHKTNRRSQIAVFDLGWQRLGTYLLDGFGCHGLAVLPDGKLLSCGSMAGELLTLEGEHWQVSDHLTRGLAVGGDGIAVGSSRFGRRDERDNLNGTVAFLDTSFEVCSVLPVPCAPTELRRLDGQDASLSLYLQNRPEGAAFAASCREHCASSEDSGL